MTADPRAQQRLIRERPGERVEVGLRPDESPADVEPEFDRSFAFADRLRAEGTEAWTSHYRWLGPFKVLAYKEVGPPPWRWPRIGIQPWRGKHPSVRLIVGWRSTAYAVVVMWFGRHRG